MSERQYYPNFDILRAFCLILVMGYHFGIIKVGWVGVPFFFVLSSFLITSILLDYKERLSKGEYFTRFYKNRALRILPVYYLFIALITVCLLVFHRPPTFAHDWPYAYTFTYNFLRTFPGWNFELSYTHIWSLAVEFQFYAVWPLIIFYLDKAKFKKFLWALLIIAPLARFASHEILSTMHDTPLRIAQGMYMQTWTHFDALAIGAFVALREPFFTNKTDQKLLGVYLLVFIIGMINNWHLENVLNAEESMHALGWPMALPHNYQYIWGYPLLSLFAGFTIAYLRKPTLIYENWLTKGLVHIGKISYGGYLFHGGIQYIFFLLLPPNEEPSYLYIIGGFALTTTVTVLITTISFKYYDMKFLTKRNHA
jgi:peptidoglycan/LPS O-acetylase OafA/YrhL